MATSTRRLATTPSRRRLDVESIETLIEAFISHHQAIGSSPATVRHYQDSLNLLQRCLAGEGISPLSGSLTSVTMNRFAGWLRSTPTRLWRGSTQRSIWGVHGALKDCKIWLGWLVEAGLLESVPKVPVPRLPRTLFPILNEADLAVIFASNQLSAQTEIAHRNRALMAFMLDTGVRLSEVATLSLTNLSLKEGSAKIVGKGSKERMVYFSDGAAEAIRRWLTIRGEEPGSLFWLEPAGVRMLFKRIKDETGLSMLTPHQVRHTALTMLVKDGVDLHTIKRLAGHASVTTTEAYLALAGEDMKDKHSRASPFDKVNRLQQPSVIGKRRLKAS